MVSSLQAEFASPEASDRIAPNHAEIPGFFHLYEARDRGQSPVITLFARPELLQSGLVGAFRLPLAVSSTVSEVSAHFITLDPSTKSKHVTRLGVEFDVMYVYGAFYPARLVGTLKMPG
jgi:hypothetical protein